MHDSFIFVSKQYIFQLLCFLLTFHVLYQYELHNTCIEKLFFSSKIYQKYVGTFKYRFNEFMIT